MLTSGTLYFGCNQWKEIHFLSPFFLLFFTPGMCSLVFICHLSIPSCCPSCTYTPHNTSVYVLNRCKRGVGRVLSLKQPTWLLFSHHMFFLLLLFPKSSLAIPLLPNTLYYLAEHTIAYAMFHPGPSFCLTVQT